MRMLVGARSVLILSILVTTCVQISPTAMPAAAAATPGTLSPGTANPDLGVQFHATWSDYDDEQRVQALDRLEAAGVAWVRIDVGWETLEPRRDGQRADWYLASIDHAVEEAERRGISIILTVFATPAWASRDESALAPPDDPADYGRVMGWLAKRYEGRVDAYEIWNEPDTPHFFEGTPRQYVKLLRAAAKAIRGRDNQAMVVAGATEYNDDQFLAEVYDAGGAPYFDVWSTHAYMGDSDAPPERPDDGTPWTIDHVGTVHALMAAHGDEDKPIWFTEFGWSSHRTDADAPSWRRGVSKAEQADHLVRAVHFVAEHHPYVTLMIWYNERNKTTGDRHEDNFGLMTHDFRPKPAFTAMQEVLTESDAARE